MSKGKKSGYQHFSKINLNNIDVNVETKEKNKHGYTTTPYLLTVTKDPSNGSETIKKEPLKFYTDELPIAMALISKPQDSDIEHPECLDRSVMIALPTGKLTYDESTKTFLPKNNTMEKNTATFFEFIVNFCDVMKEKMQEAFPVKAKNPEISKVSKIVVPPRDEDGSWVAFLKLNGAKANVHPESPEAEEFLAEQQASTTSNGKSSKFSKKNDKEKKKIRVKYESYAHFFFNNEEITLNDFMHQSKGCRGVLAIHLNNVYVSSSQNLLSLRLNIQCIQLTALGGDPFNRVFQLPDFTDATLLPETTDLPLENEPTFADPYMEMNEQQSAGQKEKTEDEIEAELFNQTMNEMHRSKKAKFSTKSN